MTELVFSERGGDLEKFETKCFEAGKVIFNEGESAGPLYIVKEGCVKLVKNHGSASELVICRLGRNAVFGEMAGVDRELRFATALAERETECYVVDLKFFESSLNQLNPFMRGLFRVLVETVRHTTEMQLKK